MGDEEKKKEGEVNTSGDGQPAGASTTEKPGEEKKPDPIPYDRFKEVNDKAKAYEAKIAELEKAQADANAAADKKRQAELKEQQKFEQLAQEWEGKFTELEPQAKALQEQLDAANKVLETLAEAQLEQVPEVFRTVVSSLPVLERLQWFAENQDKLTAAKKTGIPSTPAGKSAPELTPEKRRAKAARTF